MLGHASGRVLAVGAGTGEGFKHTPPTVQTLVALGPNAPMSGLKTADEKNDDAATLCTRMCDPSGNFSD